MLLSLFEQRLLLTAGESIHLERPAAGRGRGGVVANGSPRRRLVLAMIGTRERLYLDLGIPAATKSKRGGSTVQRPFKVTLHLGPSASALELASWLLRGCIYLRLRFSLLYV